MTLAEASMYTAQTVFVVAVIAFLTGAIAGILAFVKLKG